MHPGDDATRVVVTGIGVVSPIGIGSEAFWSSLHKGRGGIERLQTYHGDSLPTKLAAEVSDFDPLQYLPSQKVLKVMSRDIQLGVAASHMAIVDAGLNRGMLAPERVGVSFGAGRISSRPEELSEAARSHGDWNQDSLERITPMWLLKRLPNMPACHVSIGLDARGPNNTITSRDTSALLAMAEGVGVIERGAADCMVVGASASFIHPVDLVKLGLVEMLSQRDDDPANACRPFDAARDGTVLGEGAAAFVIERLDHARARGVNCYAEILGVGAGCDGRRGSDPDHAGEGLVHAITAALAGAGLAPGDLGHINAQAKGAPVEDRVEALALQRVLGDRAAAVPVTALKSYFGHFDAGSGAVELAGSLLALRHRFLPATLGFRSPDPGCELDIVSGEGRALENPVALSINRCVFGQSAAVVVRAP